MEEKIAPGNGGETERMSERRDPMNAHERPPGISPLRRERCCDRVVTQAAPLPPKATALHIPVFLRCVRGAEVCPGVCGSLVHRGVLESLGSDMCTAQLSSAAAYTKLRQVNEKL
ncbi:hypothetical protein EYF80_036553 [Liparis tanakae]|uniref:Uncharacterized protein n=1 Tax=Liparis tanakae TaxID=230148 RepID=A0A4Z2GKK9_9TELE|nr:hypothetical protein EYF80_036553 [Liparis tanakae]